MKTLSDLERAVALRLAKQMAPDESNALVAQLRSAQVFARHFTGVGFYTEFNADRTLASTRVTASPGAWVRPEVGPRFYPLDFMLYVENGYAVLIEAFSVGDGYGEMDLLAAAFSEPKLVTQSAARRNASSPGFGYK